MRSLDMQQIPHYRAFARIKHTTKSQSQTIHSVVTCRDAESGAHDCDYLPVANVLVVEANSTAHEGVKLYRYTTGGTFCGDTWHASVEDAQHQAVYEFGAAVEEWHEIPASAADATAYALTRINM